MSGVFGWFPSKPPVCVFISLGMDTNDKHRTRRYVSPKEFADIFGLSPKTIASLAKDGTIRSVHTADIARRLIPVSEIDRFDATLKPCRKPLRKGGKAR